MRRLTYLLFAQLLSQLFAAFGLCLVLTITFWSINESEKGPIALHGRGISSASVGDSNVSLEWVSRALSAQMLFQEIVPVRLLQPASTHNSFLSADEGYGLCRTLSFALQNWTLADQIRVGIRQMELDLFRINDELTVCHPCYDQCQIAALLCNRSIQAYAAPGVPVGSPYFGCDPTINLTFESALNAIWRQCQEYIKEHPQRAARELLLLHLQLHVDKSLSRLAEDLSTDPWIAQFVEELQTSIPRKAIVPAAVHESAAAIADSSVRTLRKHVQHTELPLIWILPVVDVIDPSTGRRAPANSAFFAKRASAFRNLVIPNFSPLEYPEDRLTHLTKDSNCTLQIGNMTVPRVPRNFTYFVGSIFSTREHIAEAYRCGYAVRADMPSKIARLEALLGMVWSWKPMTHVPDIVTENGTHFSNPAWLSAEDCRWYSTTGTIDGLARLWLCTTDTSALIGERRAWGLTQVKNSSCLIDIPRTGYENTLACDAIREKQVASARLQIRQ